MPGIDGPWLTTLQPWVVLLPKEAALNINTASATVLATLPTLAVFFAMQRRFVEGMLGSVK